MQRYFGPTSRPKDQGEFGYEASEDPYCYPDSNCLKNKAGLRDSERLAAFELEMTTLRAEERLPAGRFGAAHYRKVHKHLFQDVYRWAGRYRSIRTGKDGNWFCYPEYIDAQMNDLFRRLRNSPFAEGSSVPEFVRAAAGFLATLNAIHPFRDGNGRTQLAFMHLVGGHAGKPFQFQRLRKETFLPAMIASFSGEIGPLATELGDLLS